MVYSCSTGVHMCALYWCMWCITFFGLAPSSRSVSSSASRTPGQTRCPSGICTRHQNSVERIDYMMTSKKLYNTYITPRGLIAVQKILRSTKSQKWRPQSALRNFLGGDLLATQTPIYEIWWRKTSFFVRSKSLIVDDFPCTIYFNGSLQGRRTGTPTCGRPIYLCTTLAERWNGSYYNNVFHVMHLKYFSREKAIHSHGLNVAPGPWGRRNAHDLRGPTTTPSPPTTSRPTLEFLSLGTTKHALPDENGVVEPLNIRFPPESCDKFQGPERYSCSG